MVWFPGSVGAVVTLLGSSEELAEEGAPVDSKEPKEVGANVDIGVDVVFSALGGKVVTFHAVGENVVWFRLDGAAVGTVAFEEEYVLFTRADNASHKTSKSNNLCSLGFWYFPAPEISIVSVPFETVSKTSSIVEFAGEGNKPALWVIETTFENSSKLRLPSWLLSEVTDAIIQSVKKGSGGAVSFPLALRAFIKASVCEQIQASERMSSSVALESFTPSMFICSEPNFNHTK